MRGKTLWPECRKKDGQQHTHIKSAYEEIRRRGGSVEEKEIAVGAAMIGV